MRLVWPMPKPSDLPSLAMKIALDVRCLTTDQANAASAMCSPPRASPLTLWNWANCTGGSTSFSTIQPKSCKSRRCQEVVGLDFKALLLSLRTRMFFFFLKISIASSENSGAATISTKPSVIFLASSGSTLSVKPNMPPKAASGSVEYALSNASSRVLPTATPQGLLCLIMQDEGEPMSRMMRTRQKVSVMLLDDSSLPCNCSKGGKLSIGFEPNRPSEYQTAAW